MPQPDKIQFDFSRLEADRAYMEAVIERAAQRRRIRLAGLRERESALREATTAIYRLSEAGSHPHTVRLRRRFIRLKTRRERVADTKRHPQRAGLHPGRLAIDRCLREVLGIEMTAADRMDRGASRRSDLERRYLNAQDPERSGPSPGRLVGCPRRASCGLP